MLRNSSVCADLVSRLLKHAFKRCTNFLHVEEDLEEEGTHINLCLPQFSILEPWLNRPSQILRCVCVWIKIGSEAKVVLGSCMQIICTQGSTLHNSSQ